MKVKPDLSFWKLWNISFGFFGVQIAYALQSANISRIFATLGADPHNLSYFWILPPLAGIIVQPIVGAASDKTWTRFGRRIPYLFVGSLVAVLVMCLLPNAGSFGMAVSTAMIFGLVSLMFLDTSINMAMQPFKMMVGDMVNGLQVAGLVNIAKEVNGVQFAGLVNIADKSDCPIGLINIIKNGEMGVAVTYDALGSTVATFRSGGRYTYGIIGVGYNHKTENNSLVAEGGFGAHIPVTSWFRINNELKASTIGNDSDEPVLNTGYSLIPSFRIGKHIELFGGVGINYMMTKDVSNSKIFPNHSLWKKTGSTKLQQLYIGYQFGVQYIF